MDTTIKEKFKFKENYNMKKTLFTLTLMFSFCCCDRDNENSQIIPPVNQLPPATQFGANTFGCLLDGEVFIPGLTGNPLDCMYQFVDGGYNFSLQANKRDDANNIVLIGLSTKILSIEQNGIYQLLENTNGNAYGTYSYATVFSYTNQTYTGQLKITKLDFTNSIVSGTFWFDVEDNQGIIHQIREGRFDVQFTQ